MISPVHLHFRKYLVVSILLLLVCLSVPVEAQNDSIHPLERKSLRLGRDIRRWTGTGFQNSGWIGRLETGVLMGGQMFNLFTYNAMGTMTNLEVGYKYHFLELTLARFVGFPGLGTDFAPFGVGAPRGAMYAYSQPINSSLRNTSVAFGVHGMLRRIPVLFKIGFGQTTVPDLASYSKAYYPNGTTAWVSSRRHALDSRYRSVSLGFYVSRKWGYSGFTFYRNQQASSFGLDKRQLAFKLGVQISGNDGRAFADLRTHPKPRQKKVELGVFQSAGALEYRGWQGFRGLHVRAGYRWSEKWATHLKAQLLVETLGLAKYTPDSTQFYSPNPDNGNGLWLLSLRHASLSFSRYCFPDREIQLEVMGGPVLFEKKLLDKRTDQWSDGLGLHVGALAHYRFFQTGLILTKSVRLPLQIEWLMGCSFAFGKF